MNYEQATKICQQFAQKHKLVFEDKGECGLGRECVGFLHGDSYIDHNPHDGTTLDDIKVLECEDAWAPEDVNSYHKHSCLAVLGRGDEAVIGLAKWVKKMEAAGIVKIVDYDKNPDSPLQGMLTGFIGKAVTIVKKKK